jgi:hypothetical protein
MIRNWFDIFSQRLAEKSNDPNETGYSFMGPWGAMQPANCDDVQEWCRHGERARPVPSPD